MEPRFVEFKQGDIAANNLHYAACLRDQRPMMMIKRARKYAELEWDCIPLTSDSDPSDHVSNEVVDAMFALFQKRAKGAPGKPEFCGSAFTGTISKLLPETARALARDYFSMIMRARVRAV